MEQIQDEIKKYNPKLKNKIQLIGDGNMTFDEHKDITICVYISVYLYIYTYICTVLVVYGIYIIYIVFVRTLSFTFTSALLLINRSAISVRP